jgi:hypothetical protein
VRIAIVALLPPICLATRLPAQSEDVLRRFFEGKSVVVKLEMPGSEDGVDVYPGTSQPVDFPNHARRLKRFGTAVRRGEEILITKVKVKKDLIEFQLGGGGYGTFADETSSHIATQSTPKSQREQNLERDLPGINDPAAKKKAQEELDGLRRDRERSDAANRARVAEAQQIKEANIRQRRAESGSRFNLRYRPVVPEEALTPDGVMRALAEYVDFAPVLAAAGGRPGLYGEGARRPGATGPDGLRKGMAIEEVDALLGRPESISNRMEGSLKVSTSVYLTRDRRIEAEYVEGVLIRFTVTSR